MKSIFKSLITFFTISLYCVNASATLTIPYIKTHDANFLAKSLEHIKKHDKDIALFILRHAEDKDIIEVAKWLLYIRNNPSFIEISEFITKYPDWPKHDRLRRKAEKALYDEKIGDRIVISWLNKYPPLSGYGQLALAKAYKKTNHRQLNSLVQKIWLYGNLDKNAEGDFLYEFSDYLTPQDSINRIDRLLWNDRTNAAERILKHVGKDHQKLFKARIALIRNRGNLDGYIKKIPTYLKNDIGLLYNRIAWRNRRSTDRSVRELLFKLPPNTPHEHAKKWWKIMDEQVRNLIDDGQHKAAYNLIIRHGQTEAAPLAGAEWLSGWIALRYINQPQLAYNHFMNVYKNTSYPISQSRAAYWLGRTEEARGKYDDAIKWYEYSAQYSYTFYGQLSYLKIYPKAPLKFASEPRIFNKDYKKVNNNKLIKAAHIMAEIGNNKDANSFIKQAIRNAETSSEKLLISYIGSETRRPFLSVAAASEASKEKLLLLNHYYPVMNNIPLKYGERSLVMSLIRQESRFNAEIKSHAGAVGLMQLMPATARFISRKVKMQYSKSRLTNPDYNVILGSYYIEKLYKQFNKSYVLAIASYNGGPGNVNKWIKKYGDPRALSDLDDVIDWVETIPFYETRNYVQRVLESMQVYKSLLGYNNITASALKNDIMGE